MIARKDGKPFGAKDPNRRIIVYDIVETYLLDKVIADWAIDRAALAGSPGPGATPSPDKSARASGGAPKSGAGPSG